MTTADSATLRVTLQCAVIVTLNSVPSPKVQGYSKFIVTSYLWIQVKLLYPPPTQVGFMKLVSSNLYTCFLSDQPGVPQHVPNPKTDFVIRISGRPGVYCCVGGRGGIYKRLDRGA
jgi:hypothetical protein